MFIEKRQAPLVDSVSARFLLRVQLVTKSRRFIHSFHVPTLLGRPRAPSLFSRCQLPLMRRSSVAGSAAPLPSP
jgi:hypothetical protein